MTAVDIGRRTHGTVSAYSAGCRCDECRAENKRYLESWRAAKRLAEQEPEQPIQASTEPPEESPALLTIEATARLLGISRTSCYEAVHHEQLPVLRLGRRKFIPRAALEKLLSEGSPLR